MVEGGWLRALVSHPWTKLLSLVLAVAAWFWVQGQEVSTATVRVALAYRMPEGLVSVNALPTSASLSVTGPRAAVRRAQRDRPQLLVDLGDEGMGTLDVMLDSYELVGLVPGVERGSFRPEVVNVRLDEEIVRNVRVEPAWLGDPAVGHAVQSVGLDPEVAEVRGARANVEGLEVVKTLPVDISGWTEGQEVDVALDLPRGVTTGEDWRGLVSVQVVNQITEMGLDVPVRLWDPSLPYAVAEGSTEIAVRLKGPTTVLRTLPTDRIVAWVELPEGASASRYEVRFQAAQPPRYEVWLPRPDVVEVVGVPGAVVVEKR